MVIKSEFSGNKKGFQRKTDTFLPTTANQVHVSLTISLPITQYGGIDGKLCIRRKSTPVCFYISAQS